MDLKTDLVKFNHVKRNDDVVEIDLFSIEDQSMVFTNLKNKILIQIRITNITLFSDINIESYNIKTKRLLVEPYHEDDEYDEDVYEANKPSYDLNFSIIEKIIDINYIERLKIFNYYSEFKTDKNWPELKYLMVTTNRDNLKFISPYDIFYFITNYCPKIEIIYLCLIPTFDYDFEKMFEPLLKLKKNIHFIWSALEETTKEELKTFFKKNQDLFTIKITKDIIITKPINMNFYHNFFHDFILSPEYNFIKIEIHCDDYYLIKDPINIISRIKSLIF